MDTKKKIMSFVLICLWALGVIGGFGSAIYCGAYPCAVGVLAVAWMAWPKLKELANNLMEG